MAEELEAYGSTTPTFKSEMGGFQLTFYKPRAVEISGVEAELSERQIKAIDYVKEHGRISNSEYQSLTGVSKRTATRELSDLTAKGIFTTEGTTGRGMTYFLKGAIKGPNSWPLSWSVYFGASFLWGTHGTLEDKKQQKTTTQDNSCFKVGY